MEWWTNRQTLHSTTHKELKKHGGPHIHGGLTRHTWGDQSSGNNEQIDYKKHMKQEVTKIQDKVQRTCNTK